VSYGKNKVGKKISFLLSDATITWSVSYGKVGKNPFCGTETGILLTVACTRGSEL
jgi:hypothetical protein